MPPVSPRRLPRLLPIAAVACVVLAGCRSVDKRLATHSGTIETAYRREAALQADLPDAPLTWDQALQKLLADNLALRESRAAVTSAEGRRRQVFKDLLPGASVTADLSRALTDLGNLSGDDASVSLIAFLNIPGLIQFRMEAYRASLELVRARWAHQLLERELTVQLREQFLRAELLGQRQRSLRLSEIWDQGSASANTLESTPEALDRETRLWTLQTERDNLQQSIADLVGDNTRRWQPAPAGIPRFDYAQHPPDIADTARYGLLFRQLQATELEAAWLAEKGVQLQYWPDLRVNLTSPPLYSRNSGSSSGFDADQVLLTLSTSIPIDIRGNISRQLRETRRRNEILFAQMERTRGETLRRLATARDELVRNARRLRVNQLRLDGLRRLPVSPTPDRLQEDLDRLLRLDEQQANLILQQARLEGLFWLFDETRWQPADTDS